MRVRMPGNPLPWRHALRLCDRVVEELNIVPRSLLSKKRRESAGTAGLLVWVSERHTA